MEPKTPPMISDQRRLLEMLAVVATGAGKFLFMDTLGWRLPYILTACLAWAAYIYFRQRRQPGLLAYWGLHLRGFQSTFLTLLPWAVGLVVLFMGLGHYRGTCLLNWGILPIMLLYPLWGTIQQFLIVGLIGRNLHDLASVRLPFWGVVLLTATVFALVHFPALLLVGGTFGLAIVYTALYLRGHNLLALGLYHGWLGGFFFYTLLNRDPWQEVFGVLFGQ